jgi:5-methylcytosine-specific restriction endonuclease McrA
LFLLREGGPQRRARGRHAEPEALGGKDDVQNLLVACAPCNSAKGHKAIELYHPAAGREWLSAARKQIADRLNRLR